MMTFTNTTAGVMTTFEIAYGIDGAPSSPVTSEPHVDAVPVAGGKPKARIGSGVDSRATVTGALVPSGTGISGSAPSDISKLLVGRVWALSGDRPPFAKGLVTSVAYEALPSGPMVVSITLAEVR